MDSRRYWGAALRDVVNVSFNRLALQRGAVCSHQLLQFWVITRCHFIEWLMARGHAVSAPFSKLVASNPAGARDRSIYGIGQVALVAFTRRFVFSPDLFGRVPIATYRNFARECIRQEKIRNPQKLEEFPAIGFAALITVGLSTDPRDATPRKSDVSITPTSTTCGFEPKGSN